MAINLEILDASQSQLTQNEQVKNMIDKGCDVVCVNLVDRTDEGIEAVKNEEMLGTVYNDKEMASEYSDYTSIIKKWEEKLQDKEDYYYKKFSSMETALSKLNSQTSSLSGLFGG